MKLLVGRTNFIAAAAGAPATTVVAEVSTVPTVGASAVIPVAAVTVAVTGKATEFTPSAAAFSSSQLVIADFTAPSSREEAEEVMSMTNGTSSDEVAAVFSSS